jgi:hypothetical protein
MTKRIPRRENMSHGTFALSNSNTPPQIDTRPNSAAKCFTFGDGSAFVRASAIMSAVGQKTRHTFFNDPSDKMETDIDVLSVCVILMIFRQGNC